MKYRNIEIIVNARKYGINIILIIFLQVWSLYLKKKFYEGNVFFLNYIIYKNDIKTYVTYPQALSWYCPF
jgi:hypothetical protein